MIISHAFNNISYIFIQKSIHYLFITTIMINICIIIYRNTNEINIDCNRGVPKGCVLVPIKVLIF